MSNTSKMLLKTLAAVIMCTSISCAQTKAQVASGPGNVQPPVPPQGAPCPKKKMSSRQLSDRIYEVSFMATPELPVPPQQNFASKKALPKEVERERIRQNDEKSLAVKQQSNPAIEKKAEAPQNVKQAVVVPQAPVAQADVQALTKVQAQAPAKQEPVQQVAEGQPPAQAPAPTENQAKAQPSTQIQAKALVEKLAQANAAAEKLNQLQAQLPPSAKKQMAADMGLADEPAPCQQMAPSSEYSLGVEDVIQIDVLKPEQLTSLASVAPDGTINFPYIGNVLVKGRSIAQVQEEIQSRLANGYMKYPIVAVSLKESRSRKFFVYGEVLKPGSYPIEENMTVLRAISMAGGFTRFGSSSRVKVLRPKKDGPGYDTIKVNINAVMGGDPNEDLLLTQGDIVVVSEGVF